MDEHPAELELCPPDASLIELRNLTNRPVWICLSYKLGTFQPYDRAPWTGRARTGSVFMHAIRRRICLSRSRQIVYHHSERAYADA